MYNFNNAVTWFLDHEDFLTGDFTLFSEIWLINDASTLDSITNDNSSIIDTYLEIE